MKEGLQAAWPIALGYFPVAVAFGALGAQAGLGYLWIQLTSLLVFAGASQFALVGLLAQGVPPLLAATLGLLLNLRHAFYGPALRPYLKGGPLEAFLLTDEVFALALRALPGLPPGERRGYFLGLGLGAYLSWNLGTFLGALGGQGLLAWPGVGEALAFALPALFLLLALPHLKNPAALLAGGAALALHLLGQTAWGLFLAGVIGFLWPGKGEAMTLALLLLALGTFLLRFLPWRGERRVPAGQAGPALVVALFLVSAFSPPPSPEWLRAGLALLGTYLGLRLTGNLGVAVFLGAGLYGLLGALGF